MTRRTWQLVALGAGIYFLGLLVLFPASLALRWFMPAVPGLALGDAHGTVWNGEVASLEYRGWNAGELRWSLHPLALLGLDVSADVALDRDGQAMTANVKVSPDGTVELENVRGALALAELEQAGLIPRNIATGELIVNLQRLELRDGLPVAAAGSFGLTGLASPLLPGVALGDYAADVETGDAGINASFRELNAPLRIAGTAQIAGGGYTVAGSITPTGDTPDALRGGLALLGQPDASGRYDFNFSGKL